MKIKKIYIHHFRNYEKIEIEFSPGVNWIVGKNAQGKTKLIEALYLLSTGRSFRTPQLKQLIQEGEQSFFIEAEIEKEGVAQTLKISFDGETKKVQYNANCFSHFAPLIGLLPHILYAPEDIALVSGMPAYRRKFLDLHLSQIDPLYLHHLARYHRALRQRNALLKQTSEETIEPWEMSMAQSGAYLMDKRRAVIAQLEQPLQEKMLSLSADKDTLTLSYEQSLSSFSEEEILEHWQKSRKKELLLGSTQSGPHRDDVTFAIKGMPAKFYARVGQKHSIVAALRLCQWEHLSAQIGHPAFFSIDDFGAHLDQSRQAAFQSQLLNLGQVFLTSPTAHKEIFPQKQLIEVELGQVLEISCP